MILVELTAPMHGYDLILPYISITMRNLDGITFKDVNNVGHTPFPTGDLVTAGPLYRTNNTIQSGGLKGFPVFPFPL